MTSPGGTSEEVTTSFTSLTNFTSRLTTSTVPPSTLALAEASLPCWAFAPTTGIATTSCPGCVVMLGAPLGNGSDESTVVDTAGSCQGACSGVLLAMVFLWFGGSHAANIVGGLRGKYVRGFSGPVSGRSSTSAGRRIYLMQIPLLRVIDGCDIGELQPQLRTEDRVSSPSHLVEKHCIDATQEYTQQAVCKLGPDQVSTGRPAEPQSLLWKLRELEKRLSLVKNR
eukprot:s691_g18.t2